MEGIEAGEGTVSSQGSGEKQGKEEGVEEEKEEELDDNEQAKGPVTESREEDAGTKIEAVVEEVEAEIADARCRT